MVNEDGRFLLGDLTPADPAQTVTVIPKLELYRRMTDAEYEAMAQGVASQSKRIQDIFNRVENFRSDAVEWGLLVQMGTQLYGADRCAALLSAEYPPPATAAPADQSGETQAS